jgi:hypothetical protein
MESIDHYHRAVRDLNVYGTTLEIETPIARIERGLNSEWFREHDAEERFRRRTGSVQYIFIRARRTDRHRV